MTRLNAPAGWWHAWTTSNGNIVHLTTAGNDADGKTACGMPIYSFAPDRVEGRRCEACAKAAAEASK